MATDQKSEVNFHARETKVKTCSGRKETGGGKFSKKCKINDGLEYEGNKPML